MSEPPLVADVVPELAERLEALLHERGEPHLADQVTSLRVTHVCRCGQPLAKWSDEVFSEPLAVRCSACGWEYEINDQRVSERVESDVAAIGG